jgi:hypothetical protein
MVSGEADAIGGGKRLELRGGTLARTKRGETREVCNIGRAPLRTLNVCVPPAYPKGDEEMPAGNA